MADADTIYFNAELALRCVRDGVLQDIDLLVLMALAARSTVPPLLLCQVATEELANDIGRLENDVEASICRLRQANFVGINRHGYLLSGSIIRKDFDG